jgi:AcrR family transcriptional regulator
MVSQSGSAAHASSRDRLLAAAAAEFAVRGFDGARVEVIARRARVNKAMVYYHFRDKAALYRAILTDMFETVAAAVGRATHGVDAPDERVRAFIRAIAAELAAHPHFPPMWLREMGEGGRHLDAAIARAIAGVLATLAQVIEDGRAKGVFGDVDLFVTQIGIVAPLVLFAASGPVRARFAPRVAPHLANVPAAAIVQHVETCTLAALKAARTRSPREAP